MTRCADVDKLVTSYIDGDIDEHRARAVRGHARECERCAGLLADESAVAGWLADLELAEDPPEQLWRGIQQRLATEEHEDARRSRSALWWDNARQHVVPVAVAAAALALGWYWLAPASPQSDVAASDAPAAAAPDAPQAAQVVTLAGPESAGAGPVGDTFAAARRRQLADADEHFRQAVAELRAEVGGTAHAGELAARLEHLDAALMRARQDAAGRDDPASRDEVHRLYREQIALLQDAAVDGEWL